jgi:hypothetical protein
MTQQPIMGQGLSLSKFKDYIQSDTTGRTRLDDWSTRRRDLYLTTYNTHKRQTSMIRAGFELAVPANEPPLTHALDRVATGIGFSLL